MEEIPIVGRDDPADIVKRFIANYDAPAYARRARAVEDAYDQLIGRCRRQRDEWLALVRLRVGVLRALSGDWQALRALVDGRALIRLAQLHDELAPQLRVPVEPATSERALTRALDELRESIERFNRRWAEYLPTVDLAHVNKLRDGYNRYYLLEKECVVRSARLARQGFQRLEPLTTEHLAALMPLLPVPHAKL